MPIVLGYETTDIFSLGTDFSPQTTTTTTTRTLVETLAADGDVACTPDHDARTEISAEYKVCSKDVGGGVTTLLDTKLSQFGGLIGGYVVSEIEVEYSNTDLPTVRISGWVSDTNTPVANARVVDVSALFPNQNGIGITAPSGFTVNDAQITSLTMTATLELMENLGADGEYFEHQNRTFKVKAAVSGIGEYGEIVLTDDWIFEDKDNTDSNSESDTFSINCYQNVDFS